MSDTSKSLIHNGFLAAGHPSVAGMATDDADFEPAEAGVQLLTPHNPSQAIDLKGFFQAGTGFAL
ncbi:MAG: hypothetical protein HEQ37_07005 [Acidovorax sp.]|nr:hypothetical protein [Acidovorax sp.]